MMGKETDAMICRACGNEERASEGYPCDGCGTFICMICSFKGVLLCKKCAETAQESADTGDDLLIDGGESPSATI